MAMKDLISVFVLKFPDMYTPVNIYQFLFNPLNAWCVL